MATQWAQTVLGQFFLIILVIFHYLKSKVCARCIVFGSHGSEAAISALLFNFGYWPEPHCSPAFPNLGGIPPPGNMVYKKRHQAQPLRRPPPVTLHPPGSIHCVIRSTLFPFTSLAIPVYASPCLLALGVPWIIPPGSLKEGGPSHAPVWPLDTGTCVVHNWR